MKKVVVYVDGGCSPNPGPGAIAAVVGDEHGEVIIEGSKALENVTNNEAEYRALLLGIALARMAGATHAHFCSDSQLVVNQVAQWWAIRDTELSRLHGFVSSRMREFDEWSIQHVPRGQNRRADWLCNELMDHTAKHQLKDKPGIEFRSAATQPGWSGLPLRQASLT